MSTTRRGLLAAAAVFAFAFSLVVPPESSSVDATGLFGARGPGDAGFVAGHRGDRTAAPENTLPALRAAIEGPMDVVETDVRLSADGVPVLFHDHWLDRTTDGSGRMRDLTLAELQGLDAGSWFSKEFAGERIPTLESFLALLAHSDKRSLIELKEFWTPEEAAIVTELLQRYGVAERVILAAFDRSTLMSLESADPTIRRALLASKLPNDPVRLAEQFGAVAIVTSFAEVRKNRWIVERTRRAGIGLILYTLNSEERWETALKLGVDGIVTDKPLKLGRWLDAATSASH